MCFYRKIFNTFWAVLCLSFLGVGIYKQCDKYDSYVFVKNVKLNSTKELIPLTKVVRNSSEVLFILTLSESWTYHGEENGERTQGFGCCK